MSLESELDKLARCVKMLEENRHQIEVPYTGLPSVLNNVIEALAAIHKILRSG
jgi:hypothetical protein